MVRISLEEHRWIEKNLDLIQARLEMDLIKSMLEIGKIDKDLAGIKLEKLYKIVEDL